VGENSITFLTWFKDLSKKTNRAIEKIQKTSKALHKALKKHQFHNDFKVFIYY
jgi:hypothetical protein